MVPTFGREGPLLYDPRKAVNSGQKLILPYKISTLLYCFNERDEVLLMERTREPNRGLWSPSGGKLHSEIGESPYACACREAAEELGLIIASADLHLLGIVSEEGKG